MSNDNPSPVPISIRPWLLLAVAFVAFGCGGGGSSGGGDTSGGGSSAPASNPVTLSVEPAEVLEGSGGGTTELRFRLFLDAPASDVVEVDYATSDLTALDPSDYAGPPATHRIPAGDTEAWISIPVVADDRLEPDEVFTLSLDRVSSNATLGTASARGTILNDDLPRLSLSSPSIEEGDAGSRTLEFVLSLDGPSDDVSVDYLTVDDTATAGVDFTGVATPRTITIPAGDLTAEIRIEILGDLEDEDNELFRVALSGLVGDVVLENDEATGTILDDDDPVVVPPSSASVSLKGKLEGDAGAGETIDFFLRVDPPSADPIVIDWATADGDATAPSDYVAASGTLSIPASSPGQSFSVELVGDDVVEPQETFYVDLTLVSGNVILVNDRASGVIVNDDRIQLPELRLDNVTQLEGDSGTTDMVFEVTLSEAASDEVTVSYATSDDSATAGSDYTAVSGSLSFAPGVTEREIRVPIQGDTAIELDERFFLSLSAPSANARIVAGLGLGVIESDDPLAEVRIENLSRPEGDQGTTAFEFTIELDQVVDDDVEFVYELVDDTAVAVDDYAAARATASVPAGSLTATLLVEVVGDEEPERDERFRILLSDPSDNAVLATTEVQGTIVNDDSPPGWSGEELVAETDNVDVRNALAPRVAIGPAGERHVVFNVQGASGRYDVSRRVSPAAGVWNPIEPIGAIASPYDHPRMVVDDAGEALAVWPSPDAVANETLGGVWQTAATLAAGEVVGSVAIAQSPATGAAVAAWAESATTSSDGYTSVWASRYDPAQGWIETELVETAEGYATEPEVAIAANGDALVVFTQPPGATGANDVVAYRNNGGGWIGPVILDAEPVYSVTSVALDMDAAGNAVVAWEQGRWPDNSVAINRFDAAQGDWLGATEVEIGGLLDARDPDVALDGAGNVFVIWQSRATTNVGEGLWANRLDAASGLFGGAMLLERDDAVAFNSILSHQVVADDLGNAIAVWGQNDGEWYNIRGIRYSASDAAWGVESLLEGMGEGDAYAPHVAIERASGNAMVVWHQVRPHSVYGALFPVADIYANRFTAP